MTEQPPTDLPPPAAPAAKPTSVGRRVLTIGLAIAVAIGAAIGTNAILHAINDRPDSETQAPSEDGQNSGDEAPDDQPSDEQVEVFTSAEHAFSADFPSDPQVQSMVQEIGEFEIPITMYSASDGPVQYMVSAAEMPPSVLDAQDLDTFLTNSLTGAAQGGGAQLDSQSFTTLSGERAITGTMSAQGLTVYTVIALRDGLQFSVSVLGTDVGADVAQAFFDSFTFN
jgi:hypothetical protein